MRHIVAACLIAAAGSVVSASDLVWVATEFDNTAVGGGANDPYKDISSYSSSTSLFRIGSNPISVAFDGTNLYVGGNVNGPTEDPPGTPLTIEVAEISDFFGAAGAKEVLGSEILASDLGAFSGRGFTGMDWDDQFGLLVTVDRGSDAAAGPQTYLFQRTDPGDFNATLQLSTTGIRGISGPAFDHGYDGNGFTLADATMGPAAAVPLFGQGSAAGLDPTSFAFADDLYGVDFGSPTDPMAPLYTFYDEVTGPDTGSIWRDFDIHPTTGLVAARGNNAVVLGDRTDLNGTTNLRSIVLLHGPGIAVNQNIEIIHNPACGPECIVVNDRPNSGTFFPFTQTVLFYDLNGNPLTYEIQMQDGSLAPLDLGNPANIFSFFWDEASQVLFVVDGNNRDVYALTLKCPAPPACAGDIDGDGSTGVFDFAILAANFGTSGHIPYTDGDLDGDGDIDIFDFAIFAADFGCVP